MEFRALTVGVEEKLSQDLYWFFRDKGYHVPWVDSAEEAAQVLEWATLDLLIVDLDVLDLTGISLIQSIRSKSSKATVLAVSLSLEKTRQSFELGCDTSLRKPLSFDRLQQVISTLIKQKEDEEFRQALQAIPRKDRAWPKGHILLLEPDFKLASILTQILRNPLEAQGFYAVERTEHLERAFVGKRERFMKGHIIG